MTTERRPVEMDFDVDSADVAWSCARKRAYPSRDVAQLATRPIMDRDETVVVRPYACRNCGMWHIGGGRFGKADPRRDLGPDKISYRVLKGRESMEQHRRSRKKKRP